MTMGPVKNRIFDVVDLFNNASYEPHEFILEWRFKMTHSNNTSQVSNVNNTASRNSVVEQGIIEYIVERMAAL